MSLSDAEIALVVREVREAVCPGRVDQIYQLSPTDLSWKIRTPHGPRHLLLSAHPTRSRLHLLTRAPTPPEAPPDFARSLRNHLGGALLTGIEQAGSDRVVTLAFEKGPIRCTFVAEIMGRGSHLLLVDGSGEILAALKPYRGRRRTLVPGVPYVPPKRPDEPRPPSVRPFLGGEGGPSRLVEAFYREEEEKAGLRERVSALSKSLGKAKRKASSAVRKMRASLAEAAEADKWQRMGEALKMSLSSMTKGMEEVVLPDLSAPGEPRVRIPLDPARTPVENMASLFRKARKLKRGRGVIEKRLARAEGELQEILEAEAALGSAEAEEGVTEIEEAVRSRGWLPRTPSPKGASQRRLGHRRFTSLDGIEIWVGKSGRENEEMTFRRARGEDLFLHVDGRPGSHVIVRLGRGVEIPQETLLDAAELAAHFSSARDMPKVQVIYAPRKHVSRGKRDKVGQVTVARERTILLRREPKRLRRVLDQEEVLR